MRPIARWSTFHVPALVLVLAFTLPTSALANVSIGANLGVTIRSPEIGENTTVIGIPSQATGLTLLRPGLRVGVAREKSHHEVYADVSFDNFNYGGENIRAIRLGGNYQYNLRPEGKSTPYVTAGIGMFNVGDDFGPLNSSATSFTAGGGLGMGVPLSENHGRFRVEARYDHMGRAQDGNLVLIVPAHFYQFVAGFDLWLR